MYSGGCGMHTSNANRIVHTWKNILIGARKRNGSLLKEPGVSERCRIRTCGIDINDGTGREPISFIQTTENSVALCVKPPYPTRKVSKL